MSSKYALVVIVIIAAILVTGFDRNDAQADTDLVTNIQYSPDPVIVDETVEFSCELTDETGVDTVVLNMCTDMFCFPPVLMEKGTDDVWRGSSDAVTDVISHHFNITINFGDGSSAWTEDIYFTPQEKTNDKPNDDDDDNGLLPAMGAVAVLAVLTALAMTRRGRTGR